VSRPITASVLSSMMAQESAEGYVLLLAITHASISVPIRVASAGAPGAPFVSQGESYIYCPFTLDLPGDDPESINTIEVSIDNVDRSIAGSIRQIPPGSVPPGFALSVVTLDLPDAVEVGPLALSMLSVSLNRLVVTGSLSYEPILDRSYPSARFFPFDFPGMF